MKSCQSIRHWISFFGLSLAMVFAVACTSENSKGLIAGNMDLAVRNGDLVTTPASANTAGKWNSAKYAVRIMSETADGGMSPCTGSLIHRKFVLTAAHCIYGVEKPQRITVVFGVDNPEYAIAAADFRMHNDYNTQDKDNDLAIIELSEEAPKDYEQLLLPLKINLSKIKSLIGVGYGRTHGRYDDSTATFQKLRQVEIDLEIEKPYHHVIPFDQKVKGLCFGDSGGPGILRAGQYSYVVGIAKEVEPKLTSEMILKYHELNGQMDLMLSQFPSFDMCANIGYYTNAQVYAPWILSTMGELSMTENPPYVE